MQMSLHSANANTIEQELDWFQQLILVRGKITFEQSLPEDDIYKTRPPDVEKQDSPYARLIKKHAMSLEERLILILALIP